MKTLWRSLAALSLALVASGCGYNRIQQLDEQVSQAQGQIETQLQRRADLIPNLVNTVKGFAAQEERVLTEVTRARAGLPGGERAYLVQAGREVASLLKDDYDRLTAILRRIRP